MTKPSPHPLAAVVLALALTLSAAWPAAAAAPDDLVTLNFVNADIDAVVKAVAEITGRNFVVDPRVKGVINIVSARPVPRDLVYPTLLSALRLQGFAVIEGDGMTKIVPEAEAKQQGSPVVTGSLRTSGDRLVTKVFVLRNESATQLVNVLRPLIAPNNSIAAFPTGNALVITDYAENLKRIDQLIAALDLPPAAEPVVIPIRYASALDLTQMLTRLLADQNATAGAPADPQQRVTVVADPRSNSVLVRADNPARIARVRALIEQLDTQGRAGGNIFIIYLKNAEATHVAQMLRGLLTGSGGDSSGNSSQSNSPMVSSPALANAAPGLAAAVANSGAGTNSISGNVGAFSGGGATIQADSTNNALIIMAPEPIYNNIRAVVEKLDVRRAQVYVEALIVELTTDRAAEFGIQWQYLQGFNSGNTSVAGGTNFGTRGGGTNILDIAQNPGSAGNGLNLGIVRGTITIPGLGTITNLALLVRALDGDNKANILSTPNLLTLDNEEAKIVVGQNVPFITGQYVQTANASTVTPFQTIERKDVGLTLRVKPQITEGGTVRMSIYEEVSRVDSTSNPAGIITDKRSLESTVLVDDGQIIVLGGLIQDSQTDASQKIPLLGDIPIAGALFRYDTRDRSKTNLMVFLRPTIVRTMAIGAELTNDRYDYIIDAQKRLVPEERLMLPEMATPQLPPVPLPRPPSSPLPSLLPEMPPMQKP